MIVLEGHTEQARKAADDHNVNLLENHVGSFLRLAARLYCHVAACDELKYKLVKGI